MWKENILFYSVIGLILLICLRVYYEYENYSLKCIISNVDGNTYCVRDRVLLKESVELLAKATSNMNSLVAYMKEHHPKDPRVIRLVDGYNPSKISETLPTSELTAYSENKGEKLAFCLAKTKNGSTLIDINTLTFVAIHELAHIMTESIGHKQEFWLNFKYLLENAKKARIYDPVDYKKDNQSYCGMTITDNPYYDM